MDKFYDFTDCRLSLKQFGGSDKKISVFFDDSRYMLKFNDRIATNQRNELNSSSRNNVFSEYISCHIIKTLDVPVQETLIGTYKGKIVVACKDFCENGYQLNEFENYKSSLNSKFENERYPEINEVVDSLRIRSELQEIDAEKRFWDTFVIDSVLGNFDRHTGNWGYLYNDEKNDLKLSPIYDCGACLYPMLADKAMEKVLLDEAELNQRIYNFPKAAFMDHGVKVSYHQYLQSENVKKNEILRDSIKTISEKIDLKKITHVINKTPGISEIRRDFYSTMLENRIEKILYPAYDMIKDHYVTINHDKNDLFNLSDELSNAYAKAQENTFEDSQKRSRTDLER